MMNDKLITLAVHTNKKALILQTVLERENIEVRLENITAKDEQYGVPGVRVRIKEEDLSRALVVVESNGLFNYDEEDTHLIDDGNRRILVPVDFSDYSLNACRVAFTIAEKFKAKVKILNVYYNPYYPVDLPISGERLYAIDGDAQNVSNIIDKVRAKMQKLCAEIDKNINDGEFPPINYSYSVREGIAEEEITEYCKSYKPSLIVIGVKGRDNNNSNVLGSVTADVIEMVNIPVLAIPKESFFKEPKSVKHIAFCTNFSERDLQSFDYMARFMQPQAKDIKITLLHINVLTKNGEKWSEDKIQKLRNYFTESYPDLNIGYKLIDTDDMFGSIAEYAEKDEVEIITVNTRRRNIFSRMLMPSMSRKILARSNTALLVLRGV